MSVQRALSGIGRTGYHALCGINVANGCMPENQSHAEMRGKEKYDLCKRLWHLLVSCSFSVRFYFHAICCMAGQK